MVSVYFNVCFHDDGDLLYLLVTCIPLQWIAGTYSLHFLVSSLLFFDASFPPRVEIGPVGNAAWPLAEVGCRLSVVLFKRICFPPLFKVRILFVSLSPLVCGWKDNLGATSGEEGADKQERSWNWKCAANGPPPCCWELTWTLSFSCLVPQTGQAGYHRGSGGSWVCWLWVIPWECADKEHEWSQLLGEGQVALENRGAFSQSSPDMNPLLRWTSCSVWRPLWQRSLRPCKSSVLQQPEDRILSNYKWVVLFCSLFPTQFFAIWGISGTS